MSSGGLDEAACLRRVRERDEAAAASRPKRISRRKTRLQECLNIPEKRGRFPARLVARFSFSLFTLGAPDYETAMSGPSVS
jgi:hypothetical protein